MILLKRLSCGKDTLVLVTQTDWEAKDLREFAEINEPLVAEIKIEPRYTMNDLTIRKEKDLCKKTQKP